MRLLYTGTETRARRFLGEFTVRRLQIGMASPGLDLFFRGFPVFSPATYAWSLCSVLLNIADRIFPARSTSDIVYQPGLSWSIGERFMGEAWLVYWYE